MERRNAWKTYTQEQLKELDQINDRYKVCLDEGKTERECIRLTVKEIEKQGYRNLNDIKGSLKTGDKVYAVCMGKSIAMFRIGKEPLENGMNILGAHIDSPRIDVKQNPLYDIEHDVNSFSFKTNFTEDKFVVLQIPYDKGWSLKANQENVDIYKGQGGFVSFLAKKGETQYYFEY